MGKFIEVQMKDSTYIINTDHIVSISLKQNCIHIALRKQYANIEITGDYEKLKRKYLEFKSKIFGSDHTSNFDIPEDLED